jgi:hypothetical protein
MTYTVIYEKGPTSWGLTSPTSQVSSLWAIYERKWKLSSKKRSSFTSKACARKGS